MKKKICMIVQDPMVKGGIAAVVNGYYGSEIENRYSVTYVQSYRDGNKYQKLWKAIKAYIKFLFIMIIDKPDIVHMHTSFGASFYRQIPFIYMACFRRVPVINHIHGPEFDKFFEQASEKKKRLIKQIYNKCTKLITLSEEWKINFLKVVPEDKIVVIENYSILVDDIDNEERNWKQALFLGAINERKGCYDMPAIVEAVLEKVPDARFVIAGDGELDNLKKQFNEKKLDQYCCFPGWVRDKEKDSYLRESGIFFLPSYNEGMPMAILDAMGYDMPVVSTNVGGIPKIVLNGINGYVCKPGDVKAISDSLVKIMSDKVLAEKMGAASRKLISEKYTLQKHFERLFELYEIVSE